MSGILSLAAIAIVAVLLFLLLFEPVVVPGRWNNHPLTRLASRRRYGRLLEAGLNDEVNLAVLQPALAGRLEADFAADLASSAAVTLEDWRRRGLGERAFAALARVLERQA